MVKFQSEAERMSTRAAAAAGSGGERGRRRRARAGVARGCFQKAARFLLGEKIRVVISFVSPRYSQHILGLW